MLNCKLLILYGVLFVLVIIYINNIIKGYICVTTAKSAKNVFFFIYTILLLKPWSSRTSNTFKQLCFNLIDLARTPLRIKVIVYIFILISFFSVLLKHLAHSAGYTRTLLYLDGSSEKSFYSNLPSTNTLSSSQTYSILPIFFSKKSLQICKRGNS